MGKIRTIRPRYIGSSPSYKFLDVTSVPPYDITSRNLHHSKRNGASESRAILTSTTALVSRAIAEPRAGRPPRHAIPRHSPPMPTVAPYNTLQGVDVLFCLIENFRHIAPYCLV